VDHLSLPPPLPPKEKLLKKSLSKSWQPIPSSHSENEHVQKTVLHVQQISEDALWALDDLQKTLGLEETFEEQFGQDGKYERFYVSGERLVWYPNGTVKEAYPDGHQIVYFTNGDKKKV
jgi:hypothetical protein